ncbi:MAG: helix-turn-helix domain-containing protein, partial [Alphaproteobacteria bacterium]
YSQETITADVVEAEFADVGPSSAANAVDEEESLTEAVERHLKTYFDAHEGELPASGLYDRVLREMERPLIRLSLGATRGNQVRAAQLLGLNRNTLRKKIRDLDIAVVRGSQ